MHLLAIFAAVALPIVIGFVFFMDGAEPYPRQVVGYLRRRTMAIVRRTPARVRARVRGAQVSPGDLVFPVLPARTAAPPPDLTGRVIARLRRPRPLTEESR